ncbi:BnaC06g01940D [Brassica napus]|nr:BnaC06g01940D [Brassica napus]
MTALAMGLFARRPPLVVPRSRCQPPPLKPP